MQRVREGKWKERANTMVLVPRLLKELTLLLGQGGREKLRLMPCRLAELVYPRPGSSDCTVTFTHVQGLLVYSCIRALFQFGSTSDILRVVKTARTRYAPSPWLSSLS